MRPPNEAANWIVGEVAPTGKPPSAANLGELVKLVTEGNITRDQGREVLAESVRPAARPEIVAEHGFSGQRRVELQVLAQAVIDANPKAAADYRGGKRSRCRR